MKATALVPVIRNSFRLGFSNLTHTGGLPRNAGDLSTTFARPMRVTTNMVNSGNRSHSVIAGDLFSDFKAQKSLQLPKIVSGNKAPSGSFLSQILDPAQVGALFLDTVRQAQEKIYNGLSAVKNNIADLGRSTFDYPKRLNLAKELDHILALPSIDKNIKTIQKLAEGLKVSLEKPIPPQTLDIQIKRFNDNVMPYLESLSPQLLRKKIFGEFRLQKAAKFENQAIDITKSKDAAGAAATPKEAPPFTPISAMLRYGFFAGVVIGAIDVATGEHHHIPQIAGEKGADTPVLAETNINHDEYLEEYISKIKAITKEVYLDKAHLLLDEHKLCALFTLTSKVLTLSFEASEVTGNFGVQTLARAFEQVVGDLPSDAKSNAIAATALAVMRHVSKLDKEQIKALKVHPHFRMFLKEMTTLGRLPTKFATEILKLSVGAGVMDGMAVAISKDSPSPDPDKLFARVRDLDKVLIREAKAFIAEVNKSITMGAASKSPIITALHSVATRMGNGDEDLSSKDLNGAAQAMGVIAMFQSLPENLGKRIMSGLEEGVVALVNDFQDEFIRAKKFIETGATEIATTATSLLTSAAVSSESALAVGAITPAENPVPVDMSAITTKVAVITKQISGKAETLPVDSSKGHKTVLALSSSAQQELDNIATKLHATNMSVQAKETTNHSATSIVKDDHKPIIKL